MKFSAVVQHKFLILTVAAGLAAAAVPGLAHHSFAAEYDSNKPVTLQGKITKVEWTNPHARFYIDVVDENGKTTNWNLELGSPNVLRRMGWKRTSIKEGDMVTVEGSRAKDDSFMANARSVTLANGQRVFAGSSEGQSKGK